MEAEEEAEEEEEGVTAFKVVKEPFVLPEKSIRNSVHMPRGTYS